MADLHKLFYPGSVAVAGVSPRTSNLAAMIVRNLESWNFRGAVYGINPVRQEPVGAVPVYATMQDIPGPVDLLIVLSPARTVPDLLDQCAAKGTPFAIIETAGFSELNAQGAALGQEIQEKASAHGIRLVGPNCLGVINAEIGLCAPFSFILPYPAGNVSIISQSGGVGLTLILGLHEHNLFANKMVSMGNKYDLNECDYLEYLMQDPGTEVIAMFLESMADGRRFAQLASRCPKPILVYKGNTTPAGRQRAKSHTASLAGDDAVADAAFAQFGVTRVRNINDLITHARMFTQPRLRGNRITVISPAGGFTVMAADEYSEAGFTFPQPDAKTLAAVRERVRAGVINIENPMDMGDAFSADNVLMAMDKSLAQDTVDGGVIMMQRRTPDHYVGPFKVMARNIAPDVQGLIERHGKPVAITLFALPRVAEDMRGDTTVPVFTQMGATVRAMGDYLRFCTRAVKPLPVKTPSLPGPAARILKAAAPGLLIGKQAFELLNAAGISSQPCAEATDPEQAAHEAARIGFPAALKITSRAMSHKSDAGGVILDIKSPEQALTAAKQLFEIMDRHNAPGTVLVQKMAEPEGVECLIGARRDPSFGPVVVFGLGGVFVEVLRDTVLRLAPLDRTQARAMILGIAGLPLLTGARGRRPVDMRALESALVSVSRLAAAAPRILEMDLNPMFASAQGCTAADCRIILA